MASFADNAEPLRSAVVVVAWDAGKAGCVLSTTSRWGFVACSVEHMERTILAPSYDPVLAGRPPKLAVLSSRVSSPCRCGGCSLARLACFPEVV